MKKSNRRSFLQSVGKIIGGVLGLGVVGLPKAKAKPVLKREGYQPLILANGAEDVQGWRFITCIYNNRRIFAEGRRIKWSKFGEYDKFEPYGYMDLPILDICQTLRVFEDQLYWLGNREIWRVRYIEGDLVFRCEKVDPYCFERLRCIDDDTRRYVAENILA